jgi:hypothetical protein
MGIIKNHYKNYEGRTGFDTFHNQIINMPRDHFSDTSIDKIKLLAGYLLITEGELPKDGCDYKTVMKCIAEQMSKGKYPDQRCTEWETTYFTFTDINSHYESQGRMFRHLMGICSFFGMIKSLSKNKKCIRYDQCREYTLSSSEILMPVVRNNMISLSAETNDYIKSIKEIEITKKTKYRPAYAILKYMQMINRPVTAFEISVLFGRIDNLKIEGDILNRALEIGGILPATQQEQLTYFFNEMGWQDKNGQLFTYAASQAPHFKFQNFILYLQAFNLIEINNITNLIFLTQYAIDLLSDGISYLLADLELLLNKLDDGNESNRELNDLILYHRNPELLELAKSDDKFIQKVNERSINNPVVIDGKKKRNKLVAELSKILADYKCQYAGKHIFKMPNGKYYCEAHHIIRFSDQDGPDITENMVVLGPEAHMIVHHACKEDVTNLYIQLIKNGAIKYEQFERMATIYHCLTKEHITILFDSCIITQLEKEKLLELVA